jgi:hypothetical protein
MRLPNVESTNLMVENPYIKSNEKMRTLELVVPLCQDHFAVIINSPCFDFYR